MAEPSTYSPAEQAAAEVMLRHYDSEYDASHLTWRDFADEAREILAAAGPPIRREEAEAIAVDIERELVCCDVYERGSTYAPTHAICYWGAASAKLARDRAADHTTTDQGGSE